MQVIVCPSCGEENPSKFRLCGYCGTPLAQALPPQELRKTVTILFSDLKGSTALGESVDPEALHEIKNRYFEAMAAVLDKHGGKIEKYIGDAIMAVFGLPRVREDDALRAVRAGLGMQQMLARLNVDLERGYGITLAARMGINTGEVVATADPNADQRLADGDAVNVAARLEQAAPAMEVLIGDITYQLVRDHVEVEPVEPLTLKGKAEPVPAYRLVGLRSAAAATSMRDAPLVGREEEMAILGGELRAATTAASARLVTVIGDAGVGKSRLINEFVVAAGTNARVVRGRCLPYGDGITFWPIVEITRVAAGITDEDSPEAARGRIGELLAAVPDGAGILERVASAVGLSTASYPVSELFWAIRKLLEALAEDRPLLVVVDDIHSAETTFLELLDHLVDSADAPMLLLASARHEILEHDPDWGERAGASRLILRPLTASATEAMIDRLLGRAGLAADIRGRIAQAAEGNPLFVEQLVSMLVDRDMIRVEGSAWVAAEDLSALSIPPTINALLAARLDHLSREERAVIEPASVIGLVFPEPAIEELVPDALRSAVKPRLSELDRKQFVHPAEADEDVYRFHHLLIRDAAYNSLLKRTRAQLHERFVTWAERVNRERDREMEFEEILGYHLEQAYRYRQDLGPIDDEAAAVGRNGAHKLASAGRRASARGDMPAAVSLLSRAAALLPEEDPLRLELLPELAEALIEEGEFDRAVAVLDEAGTTANRLSDERLACRVGLERLALELYRSESGGSSSAIEETERAIGVFDRTGDQPGLARAWRLLMLTHGTVGRFEDAARAAERFVRHATRAGDLRLAARGASGYASVAMFGPTPVAEMLAKCEELIEQVGDDRKAVGVISGVLAVLHAMQGSFDRARELYRDGRRMLEELGPSVTASSTSTESSRVEFLAGDPKAAERELRRDYDALGAIGEKYFRSTIAGHLAEALYRLGRFEEAAGVAGEARGLAAEDDTASQVLWRFVRAKLAARRGEVGAIALAEEAVHMVEETPSPSLIADAKEELGIVLHLAGRAESAGPPWREALELYEGKGDVVSAARVRARLAEQTERVAQR